MWVHEKEQREIVERRQESGSEEKTMMWKRRKKRVMRQDGERDTSGRCKRGMKRGWDGEGDDNALEIWRAVLPGAEN